MADIILRLAEAERHRAELALDAHYDTCATWPQENCPQCRELAGLAAHAARQVALIKWKQALAGEAAARRRWRGRRPAPAITGIRIEPGRQP